MRLFLLFERTRGHALLVVALTMGTLGAACARPSTAPQPATVRVHTEPATSTPAATEAAPAPAPGPGKTNDAGGMAALPKLSSSAAPLAEAPVRRISELNAPAGSSIADVAQTIGKRFGLNVYVDPDVRGTIAASLRDVTLDEALHEIIRKNGYAYQLQGRTLRVTTLRLSTRIFTLDYVALARVGTANTVIQRRLSSGAGVSTGSSGGAPTLASGSPGSGLSSFPGGDVITATNVSDLWTELRVTLQGMLSRSTGTPAPATPGAAPA